jgi:hypothetical protein
MSNAEQQAEELEVLSSIFPDELQIESAAPTHKFKVSVVASPDAEACHVSIYLCFELPSSYPDTIPLISVEPIKPLGPSQIKGTESI